MTQPTRHATDARVEDREAVTILLHRKADYLTEWEIDFLHGLALRGEWSEKQQQILDTLWDDVMCGRREAREA